MERATSLARREGADVCDRSRRTVLNWAGATLAGAAAFGFDPLSLRLTEALAKNGVVDLGTGDIALLNYAYALEQLEAAFYTAVMASPYSGMTRYERSVLSDVKGHEIAPRVLSEGARQQPHSGARDIIPVGRFRQSRQRAENGLDVRRAGRVGLQRRRCAADWR